MGNLLSRFWMNVKLSRGRCEWCGAILPDVHPIKDYQACSQDCATQLWAINLS